MEVRLSLFIVHLVSRNDKRRLSHNDGNVLAEANALDSYCDHVVAYLQLRRKYELQNFSIATANLGGRQEENDETLSGWS